MENIKARGKREHWASRGAFVFAAIGSAVGLGNIWRFPRICAENGGAAFLVAYIVALFVTGIPILILELTAGRHYQQATSGCFREVGKKYEWIGWCIVGVGFLITTYYAVVMSWCCNYFVFGATQTWGTAPKDFFFNSFLKISDPALLPAGWGRFSVPILIGTVVSWGAIIGCLWKGVNSVSKVVYYTVFIPWVLLVIFVIRGLSLPGASEGLKYYLMLGKDSLPYLWRAKTWLSAFTQVFFSLSIGFGILFAYGSYIDFKGNIVKSAFIIGIADSLTAIVGGFAVFAALGYLATPEAGGIPIKDWMESSLSICFVAYPILINKIPLGWLFGPLFFMMLLTLAIDSAFSLVEASVAPLRDKFGGRYRKWLFLVSGLSFMLSLPHMFQSGLFWFDILDNFANQFGLAIACLMECIIFGYIFGADNMRLWLKGEGEHLGKWWSIMIRYVSPVILVYLISNELIARIRSPYGGYPRKAEFLAGWMVLALVIVAGVVLSLLKGAGEKRGAQ